jgi:hypothetical protein
MRRVPNHLWVPTPPRFEVSRDRGPKVDGELGGHMERKIAINLGGFQVTPEVSLREDGDAIIIDGQVLEILFVEKPVSGEDHNAYVYFRGGDVKVAEVPPSQEQIAAGPDTRDDTDSTECDAHFGNVKVEFTCPRFGQDLSVTV